LRLLLDTHALLWWFDELPALSSAARAAIASAAPRSVLVSSVTAFEIATKHATGKLGGMAPLLAGFDRMLAEQRFAPLPVEMRHAVAVADLPMHHRDPFDRLLIAQARVEGLTLVSIDDKFDRYEVPRLW
jgi:PIN domain nuclease of toxin-antitoxin system